MLSALILVSLLPGAFVFALVWRFHELLRRRAPESLVGLPATTWTTRAIVAGAGATGGALLAILMVEPISDLLLTTLARGGELTVPEARQWQIRVEQVIAGPLLEELGKALPALAFLLVGRLTTQASALSMGLLAGAGFSVFENLLVNLTAAANGDAVLEIVLVRLLFSPIMHIGCTTAVCLGLHLLSRARRRERGTFAAVLGAGLLIGLGLVLHALWNGSLLLLEETGLLVLGLGPLLLAIVGVVFLLTAMASALRASVRAHGRPAESGT